MNNTVLANVARGIGAGLAATAAMSAVLGIAYKVKTIDRQPPQLIVDAFLPDIPERENRVLAAVAHFGYGTAASIGYAVTLPRVLRGVTTGTGYGALVWLVGYEGWLPLMGILPPAHRDDRRRVGTMFAAHIVFGSVLGFALRRRLTT